MDTQRRPPSLSIHGTSLPDIVNRKFLRGLPSKAHLGLSAVQFHLAGVTFIPPIPGAAGKFITQMISNGALGITECMRWKSKNTGSKIAVCCDLRRRWVEISEQ